MAKVFEFTGKPVGWDQTKALTAARSFTGNARVVMEEFIAHTTSDGWLEVSERMIAQSAGVHWETVNRGKRKLIADTVLAWAGPLSPCRYVWNRDRIDALAAQVSARGADQKRLGDDNLCSHLQGNREELDVWAAAYARVHNSDARFLTAAKPVVRLKSKNPEARENFARHASNARAKFPLLELDEIAEQYAREFHLSKCEKVTKGAFSFDFFSFELDVIAPLVAGALAKRNKAKAKHESAPSSAEPSTYTPPPADFLQAAGLR